MLWIHLEEGLASVIISADETMAWVCGCLLLDREKINRESDRQ
jgi:hypothetical protein